MTWRRMLVVISTVGLLLTASPAWAVDEGNEGGESFTVKDPAYVEGELWLANSSSYRREIGSLPCTYPQEWWDEVVVSFDEETREYELVDAHIRRYIVESVLEYGGGPDQFGWAEMFGYGSCIQDSFVTRGDCSDGDQLAVFAQYAVRDVFRHVTAVTSDYDVSWRLGNYCLEVATRDELEGYVRDGTRIPEPIRASFPQFTTLVGLDNKVWYEVGDGENATERGFHLGIDTEGADYTLDVNVWLTGVQVDVDGDGEWDLQRTCTDPATCPGSEEQPIFTFAYENRAFHPFTIRTLWSGLAVDEVGTILTIEPGLLWNELSFDWETVEVRSSLDG